MLVPDLPDSPQIAVMGIASLNAILQEPDIAARRMWLSEAIPIGD
ncbi:MAG: hypothetical protein WA161_20380 [Pseudomonas sp.]